MVSSPEHGLPTGGHSTRPLQVAVDCQWFSARVRLPSELYPVYAGLLAGLILCRLYANSYCCCKVLSTMGSVMSRRYHSPQVPSDLLFKTISQQIFYKGNDGIYRLFLLHLLYYLGLPERYGIEVI